MASTVCTLMLFGCSTSPTPTKLPDPVQATCTNTESGMAISYQFTAPAQNQDITQMKITIQLNLKELQEASASSQVDTSEASSTSQIVNTSENSVSIKESDASEEETSEVSIESLEEKYKQLLNTMYGIDPTDVKVSYTDDTMTFEVFIPDLKAFEEKVGEDAQEALLYFLGNTYVLKDVVTSIEAQGFSCS